MIQHDSSIDTHQPITFLSSLFNNSQQQYPTLIKECYSIDIFVWKLFMYLETAEVILQFDHKLLATFLKGSSKTAK